MQARARLGHITEQLLDPHAPPGTHRDAAQALWTLCCEISPLDLEEPTSPDHLESALPEGKALSPIDAARCINDYARTKTFLAGVEHGVRTAVERCGHAHLLYAGTGPFAPLFLPLTTRFGSDELTTTLVDVHPASVESVTRCVDALGATAHVEDILCADATRVVPCATAHTDVLVVETMQRALAREPQVAIVRNLVPHLPAAAALVPERIVVDAWLAPRGELFTTPSDARIELGRVAAFDATMAAGTAAGTIPCERVQIPDPLPDDRLLTLTTTIELCPGVTLGPHDSGLTQPLPMFGLELRPGATLAFHYELGDDPGFSCVEV